MSKDYIELNTTENQVVYVRKDSVGAFEVVAPSARGPGHIKLYIDGYKFLVQIEKEEFLKKLAQ